MGTLQEKAVCSFMCVVSWCACCIIKEVLKKDVLLPCVVGEKGVVNLSEVTVNWQGSKTQEIVHSFYNGKDHPEHQEERFRGRTQLFPQEFSKGNASLLLKSLTLNDTGNYSCHAFLYDEALPCEQMVQLSVSEEEIQIEDRQKFYYSLIVVPLLLLCFVLYTKRHGICKSKEAHENSRKVNCRTTNPFSLKKSTLCETDQRGNTGWEKFSSIINGGRKICCCSNDVGEGETQNAMNPLKQQDDVKVVMEVTGNERLAGYVEDRVQHISSELQTDDNTLDLCVLQNVLNEREDETQQP